MYNAIYLMRDERSSYVNYKIGFATDLKKRVYAYTTHNPEVCCVSWVKTQEKSGRKMETRYHNDIKDMGLNFVVAGLDGKVTEWFRVEKDSELDKALQDKGLTVFKTGKDRKNQGMYTLSKG